jgi:hypothetical protein
MKRFSQFMQLKNAPSLLPESSEIDLNSAIAYNNKYRQYFAKHDNDIKQALGTDADWGSKEFAEAVAKWQKDVGHFTGPWIDGKFGYMTMGKMAQMVPSLKSSYDPYEYWNNKHKNEIPTTRVLNLKDRVSQVQNEMGATDIPLGMLLGWIQVESGGRNTDVTTSTGKFREMGLFQVSDPEAKAIGVDPDEIHGNSDTAITKNIQAGIKVARAHEANLQATLGKLPKMASAMPKGSDLYWRMVFMGFSAGDGTVSKFLQAMEQNNFVPKDWNDVMQFAKANTYGFKHSPIKWTAHVNRAFDIGNKATSSYLASTSMRHLIKQRIKRAKLKARSVVLKEFGIID